MNCSTIMLPCRVSFYASVDGSRDLVRVPSFGVIKRWQRNGDGRYVNLDPVGFELPRFERTLQIVGNGDLDLVVDAREGTGIVWTVLHIARPGDVLSINVNALDVTEPCFEKMYEFNEKFCKDNSVSQT